MEVQTGQLAHIAAMIGDQDDELVAELRRMIEDQS